MLTITKIFHFEMAHAIHGYTGSCKHIHGHSYELRVTVSPTFNNTGYLPAPGFIIDFKELKKQVHSMVIEKFDHQLLVSGAFLLEYPAISSLKNLFIFEAEPTAENLLLYIKQILHKSLPDKIKLIHLKLFETKDSFAEWTENQLPDY